MFPVTLVIVQPCEATRAAGESGTIMSQRSESAILPAFRPRSAIGMLGSSETRAFRSPSSICFLVESFFQARKDLFTFCVLDECFAK
jgi:hypothetical protein